MTEPVHTGSASGVDVMEFMLKVEPVIRDMPTIQIVISALALAIAAQKPDLTIPQLQAGIKGASEWIANYLGSIDLPEQLPKEMVN